jgi:hypothetical protein
MKWKITYKFRSPLEERSIEGLESYDEIKFEIERTDQWNILKGFTIFQEADNEKTAKFQAQLLANRILTFLTAIHNIPIDATYVGISEILPDGKMLVSRELGMMWNTITAENVDFSNLKAADEKMMSLLSHYRMGISSPDPVIKIQQFYQVIECKYGKNHPIAMEYSYIRHFVSHPKLNNKKPKDKARDAYGKDYLDLTDPKILEKLAQQSGSIKEEAYRIVCEIVRNKKIN